ncbi:BZ3500_MvSof-1268-A1-R1_Chr12-3g04019 [Microbotryum saponariae]|uniref:BZ3500_MvSof-1268-A1-R1_Chr12-3g04019 protein n=1 Tax=Microbotryum saponariae TaxID=289078 RepID=A0A2X0KSK9_9BASI|nr:BZ3500_MvSof-1268-A1-R1_Chr12-3g04019 [Microbotryum saponariae]SDA02549.1 BZ3501_MvSof-1269-A2-R1_Chr12-3g03674 [Microbotryum saponariae]
MPAAATPELLAAEPGGPKHHWSLDVAFPVYAIAFIDDETIVLAGGGGSSRTGVKNRLSMHKIDLEKRQFHLKTEHDLSKTEDAPMTIVVLPETKSLVAGINSDAQTLARGKNENLRVFTYSDKEIIYEKRKQILRSTSEDHYQKVTAFARTKPYLHMIALGSTDSQFSVLTFPELQEVLPTIEYDGDEMFDVDFHDDATMVSFGGVLGASANKLCIWPTQVPEDKSEPLSALQVIERPIVAPHLSCTFRAAKFGRKLTKDHIYTIVNSTPKVRSRKPGKNDKKSFVSVWDAKEWKLKRTRTVSMKPITAFDISLDGTMLAYGSSDLSVGVLDAQTLRPIVTILSAHGFPVTSLQFSPSGHLVVSGSADNSVRIIRVPPRDKRGTEGRGWKMGFVWTLVVLALAVWVQGVWVGQGVREEEGRGRGAAVGM